MPEWRNILSLRGDLAAIWNQSLATFSTNLYNGCRHGASFANGKPVTHKSKHASMHLSLGLSDDSCRSDLHLLHDAQQEGAIFIGTLKATTRSQVYKDELKRGWA